MISFLDNIRQELGAEIARRLAAANWAVFVVAFIRESGVDTLEPALREFVARGAKLFVLFGNAFGITEAQAIRRLQAIGAELRYHRGADTFHVKGYLFGISDAASGTSIVSSAIVGSSNLSRSGLIGGVEWSLVVESSDWDLSLILDAARVLWDSTDSTPVTEAVLAEISRMAQAVGLQSHTPQLGPLGHHQDEVPSGRDAQVVALSPTGHAGARIPDYLRARRLRKGRLGSVEQEEFSDLIIASVFALGGAPRRQSVVDLILDTWGAQFEQADLALLDSQEPPKERWIHNVDWAKRRLVVDGVIHEPSSVPYGAWVLTDAGRRAAETLMRG